MYKSPKLLLAAAKLWLVLIFTVMATNPQPIFALQNAASCVGRACNGQDPIAKGCSRDAVTLKKKSTPELLVEIRYSKRCDATWSRVTNFVQRRKPITQAFVSVGDITFVARRARIVWSKMASQVFEACGLVILNDVNLPEPVCIAK